MHDMQNRDLKCIRAVRLQIMDEITHSLLLSNNEYFTNTFYINLSIRFHLYHIEFINSLYRHVISVETPKKCLI